MEVPTRGAGRPPATSHAQIEDAAFRLFAERGFEETTLDDIAAAVGVGRRTLFRYFPSKNDIPWGQFDQSLAGLRQCLESAPEDVSTFDAVCQAVQEFNALPPEALPQHRARLSLILTTPALQAHSALRYQEWRDVIADFVAERSGSTRDDLLPRTVGHVSLALSIAAYEQWLSDPSTDLNELFAGMGPLLRRYVAEADCERRPPARRGRSAANSRTARQPRRTPKP